MNNNNTTNIQEPKICCICMTFYANPKFGQFCSKCYKENQSTTSQPAKPVTTGEKSMAPAKDIQAPKDAVEKPAEKPAEAPEETLARPVQVRGQYETRGRWRLQFGGA